MLPDSVVKNISSEYEKASMKNGLFPTESWRALELQT
jgi:hypothetical protein